MSDNVDTSQQQQPVVPVVGTPENKVPTQQPAAPQPAPAAQPATTINFQSSITALDAAINSIAGIAGATDADLQRALGVALERGDVTLIDKAFIAEKFGTQAAAFNTLAESVVTDVKSRTEQQQAKVNQAIVEVAGDQATWEKHRDAFKQTAPEHIQVAARAMLDSGLVKEGIQFVMQHTQGNVLANAGNLVGGLPANHAAGLSADEFRTQMSELKKEAGNRSLETGPFRERYDNLIKQRQIGRQAGR